MTFTQIRNYIKGLFNPIVDELKQDIEDANGVVPINFDDFNRLPQSERDNGKAYFIPDVNFNNNRPTPTGFTPIGTIISVMGNHAPSHYLICDGTTYNISDYPDLANYFEKEFGTKNKFGGDGITTFKVPDLRGEFLRGTGTNGHSKQGNGASVGVHQNGTVIPLNGHNGTSWVQQPKSVWSNSDSTVQSGLKQMWGASTGNNSNGATITTRPTNTSVLYCIATCNIYIDAKHNYSTQETVIGEWIDGKPLYQKSFTYDNEVVIPSNGSRSIVTLTSNVSSYADKIVQIWGNVFSSGGLQYRPLPDIARLGSLETNNLGFMTLDLYYDGNLDGICLATCRTNNSTVTLSEITFTIRYTKTTD